jgi:hypothetical protein
MSDLVLQRPHVLLQSVLVLFKDAQTLSCCGLSLAAKLGKVMDLREKCFTLEEGKAKDVLLALEATRPSVFPSAIAR